MEAGQEFLTNEEFLRRCERLTGEDRAIVGQPGVLCPSLTPDRLFSTSNTDAVLDPEGIRFPPFADCAERIFAFALRTDRGKRLCLSRFRA